MTQREFCLPFDDVGITATYFDLFWRRHRKAPEYENVEVRRVKDDRVLIEYYLKGFIRSWDGTSDQLARYSIPPYARIRFQALLGGGQKVSLYVAPLEPSDSPAFFEPTLSEQEVEEIFEAFITHLRNEGYEVQKPERPVSRDDVAGEKRGPTIKIQERARACRELKDAHPEWTQEKLAMEAGDRLGEILSEESVRNVYRTMGWKWKRGERTR